MAYTNQQTLLQGLQKGETAAFEQLRESSYEIIANIAKSISERKEDAEDLYSDGIEKFIRKISAPNFVLESKASTFFIGICRKTNKDQLERKNTRQKYLNEPYDEIYEQGFEESIDHKLFKGISWKCFKKLKEDCQTLLTRVFEKVPQADIAKEMGLSIGSLKNKKKNCLIALISIRDANPEYAQMVKNDEIDPD